MYRLAGGIGFGIAVGTVVSLWASRLVASQLFGVEPHDATTFVGAIVLLAGICALAGWLPARRVANLDPASILRET
jgi:ABC-type antimicrobial peptide transport system permease subunit